MQGEEEGGLVVRGRVEIDMRQPFRSVREAVMLFGEKILAGEVYANKLKEMQSKSNDGQGQKCSQFGAVTAELEETKKSLEKAKEEGNLMSLHLTSLKQELEKTKRELQQLKTIRQVSYLMDEPEAEELKFVENTSKVETTTVNNGGVELFEKKRSVKFASPPLLTKVIADGGEEGEKTPPLTVMKQMKKPTVLPVIGRFFLKKGRKRSTE